MSTWWLGFISGVSATVLGFILNMCWDNHKYRRDIKQRDESVITAIREEFFNNIYIVSKNINIIEQELKALDQKKSVVEPLIFLQDDFWDLVKINLPKKITKHDSLVKIRRIAIITSEVNETIRSRENYRINNSAMSNFSDRLKLYNQVLLGKLKSLKILFNEMKNEKWFDQ